MREPWRIAVTARGVRWTLTALGLALLVPMAINAWVVGSSSRYIVNQLARLPAIDVGLVLGTSPYTRQGNRNALFAGRIRIAARLFNSGRVTHLLVSGANPDRRYNEPRKMYFALRAKGVPSSAITLDFAGFRTLDSVVRARKIFGLDRLIVISQRYHDYRALFIAHHSGIDAYAYVPPRARHKQSLYTETREYLARVKAVLDLFILRVRPRFLGPPKPIGVDSRWPNETLLKRIIRGDGPLPGTSRSTSPDCRTGCGSGGKQPGD